MAIHDSSAPMLSNCLFKRNMAAYGAAVDIYNEDAGRPEAVFTDCVFWENESSSYGTVLIENTEPIFEHCTFDGNMALAGSAFFVFNNFTIDACIIFGGNSRPFWCEGFRSYPTSVTCTNIYGNTEGNWLDDMATLEGVNGNHALHPQFCNMLYPEMEDWTIQDDSPCAPGSDYCYGIRIGARDVNCGNQAYREVNWSEVKTLY